MIYYKRVSYNIKLLLDYCTYSALYSCWSNLISGRAKLTFRLRHNFVMKN